MGRKFVVGGNWKMNGDKNQINEIVNNLKKGPLDPNVEVIWRSNFTCKFSSTYIFSMLYLCVQYLIIYDFQSSLLVINVFRDLINIL